MAAVNTIPLLPPPPPSSGDFLFDNKSHIGGNNNNTPLPQQFIWPKNERPSAEAPPQMHPVVVDLSNLDTEAAAAIAGNACRCDGFFVVVNHGIDRGLIEAAHSHLKEFFALPVSHKRRVERKVGEHSGYASSFIGRFTSKLPWKETLSLPYSNYKKSPGVVEEYVDSHMGAEFQQFGNVYQKYCDEMSRLGLKIMELLSVGLGLSETKLRELFEINESILRLNHYPPCKKPEMVLGTGPHCDPTSLTILHQDQVDGLQVLVEGRWRSVNPPQGSFVVNVGDTLMALTNGELKSCMHRAVVNKVAARTSLAFFMSPTEEKVVRPPKELVDAEHPRKYPDFRWPMLLEFTQWHYRADLNTMEVFSEWLEKKDDLLLQK